MSREIMMSCDGELVSIITACYNCEDFIQSTIDSVCAQTYHNWELIVVDDCSTDGSVQLVQDNMARDKRIKLINLQQNMGPAKARNHAIDSAQGRYIAFLDGDDVWYPEKLEKQLFFMNETQAALSFTAYKKMSEAGVVQEGVVRVPEKVTYEQLLKSCVIGCLTAIYDARKLGKVSMPDILKRQDYGLWLKILKQGVVGFGLDEPLACYRVRKNSVSSNKFLAAQYQWRVYRQIEQLSIVKSIYNFLWYAYLGFRKSRI